MQTIYKPIYGFHYYKIIKYYWFLYLGIFRATFPCPFHNKQLRGAVVLQFNLKQGLASFFHKVPDSKHLWLYGCNYSTLSL